jgi:hypothetical protein
MKRPIRWLGSLIAVGSVACSDAQEAERVALPVVVDNSGMTPVQTDLGYFVTLSEARLVVDDLQFTIAGEAHTASVWQRLGELVVPTAHAHPGHYQGGDVTGELPGHFILDLVAGNLAPLGMAELIVGDYHASNFTFGRAAAADGLAEGDPLIGHTAHLLGLASRDGENHSFRVEIDAPDGRQLVGAPFDVAIDRQSQLTLGFELMTLDPLEGDTLFDGIDFGALPLSDGSVALTATSGDGAIADAYDNLRRTLLTHDHFKIDTSGAL